MGRQGEVEELQTQLAESKAETQDIGEKYSDLASQMQDLQEKLASEVSQLPDYVLLLPFLFRFLHGSFHSRSST